MINGEGAQKQTHSNAVLPPHTGVLLFSYPKANTGGCTAQATGFNDALDELTDAGFRVFGVSADKPASQANWRAKVCGECVGESGDERRPTKPRRVPSLTHTHTNPQLTQHGFKYNLLCDPDHSLALKTLGWSKGGTSIARSHVVVAKGGKVLDYQSPISPKDSVAQGVETVLKAGGK